jgi:hypothetical protein
VQQPKNLSIVIMDNEQFGETDSRRATPRTASTSPRWRLRALAGQSRSANRRRSRRWRPNAADERAVGGGQGAPGCSPTCIVTKSGEEQKIRFRSALLRQAVMSRCDRMENNTPKNCLACGA